MSSFVYAKYVRAVVCKINRMLQSAFLIYQFSAPMIVLRLVYEMTYMSALYIKHQEEGTLIRVISLNS